MNEISIEILIIFVLLVANGVFAMAEIAIVSARKNRLRQLAQHGNRKARVALELAESPNRFLATVQIGITLVGIFTGAFGGAAITEEVTPFVSRIRVLAPYAEQISFGIVVVIITYFTLILGELVPKRFGLGNPETIAMAVARPMTLMSNIARPVVEFLSFSTDTLLRLLGFKAVKEPAVTEDEVRGLMQEGLRAGAFNRVESQIVNSALELDQLPVHDIMTPRPKVIGLNVDDPHELIWHKIVVSKHSHFPVYAGSRDRVLGTVSVKAIYANLAANVPVRLQDLVVPPLVVPETQTVLQLVETFKQTGKHIAVVTDEFGNIVGLVTLNDVVEAIVGEFPSIDERARPSAKRREDGSWLIDALIEIAVLERELPGFRLSEQENNEFRTLAGYVLKVLGHVPKEGETFEAQGYLFEVLDMDGHRVDKILVIPAPAPTKGGSSP